MCESHNVLDICGIVSYIYFHTFNYHTLVHPITWKVPVLCLPLGRTQCMVIRKCMVVFSKNLCSGVGKSLRMPVILRK